MPLFEEIQIFLQDSIAVQAEKSLQLIDKLNSLQVNHIKELIGVCSHQAGIVALSDLHSIMMRQSESIEFLSAQTLCQTLPPINESDLIGNPEPSAIFHLVQHTEGLSLLNTLSKQQALLLTKIGVQKGFYSPFNSSIPNRPVYVIDGLLPAEMGIDLLMRLLNYLSMIPGSHFEKLQQHIKKQIIYYDDLPSTQSIFQSEENFAFFEKLFELSPLKQAAEFECLHSLPVRLDNATIDWLCEYHIERPHCSPPRLHAMCKIPTGVQFLLQQLIQINPKLAENNLLLKTLCMEQGYLPTLYELIQSSNGIKILTALCLFNPAFAASPLLGATLARSRVKYPSALYLLSQSIEGVQFLLTFESLNKKFIHNISFLSESLDDGPSGHNFLLKTESGQALLSIFERKLGKSLNPETTIEESSSSSEEEQIPCPEAPPSALVLAPHTKKKVIHQDDLFQDPEGIFS